MASMLTGLVSVGLGAPVDLVKIRLQMQTQTVLAGKSVSSSFSQYKDQIKKREKMDGLNGGSYCPSECPSS